MENAQMPLRLPKSLHQDLKFAAEAEGISLNQYCLYLLTKHTATREQVLSARAEHLLRFLAEAHELQKELKSARKKLKL